MKYQWSNSSQYTGTYYTIAHLLGPPPIKYIRDKAVRLIQANTPLIQANTPFIQSLIIKHSHKTDKFSNVYMNGEIMNSPKRVKSRVPERVSISCPTYGTRHDSPSITGNQLYITVVE